MTERKWTPGPWVASVGTDYLEAVIGPPDDHNMVQLFMDDRTPANAHLIAAAPDMYEALQDVLDDLEIGAHPHLHIDAIRAALRKADGKE